nr:hypothetical protein [Tanacetum cinerariifolium]
MNFVSSDVYMGLVYSLDVANVWKELESTYDKVNGSVIFNLLQKISSIKQGDSFVADYYQRFNSLWREFDALTKLPTCTCDANNELGLHNQLIKLMQFLMSLEDCYQSIRSTLLTRDPLPKVKDDYTNVSREESHKGIPDPSSVTESKINATCFAAKRINVNKRNNFSNNNNNNGKNSFNDNNIVLYLNLSCKNCRMIGHTIKRCYELIGYPHGFKKVANPIKQSGFKQNFNANIVPGYCVSLLSMNKLIKDSKLFVGFDQEKYYIQELKKEITLGTGSESGSLYLFDMEPDNSIVGIGCVVVHYSRLQVVCAFFDDSGSWIYGHVTEIMQLTMAGNISYVGWVGEGYIKGVKPIVVLAGLHYAAIADIAWVCGDSNLLRFLICKLGCGGKYPACRFQKHKHYQLFLSDLLKPISTGLTSYKGVGEGCPAKQAGTKWSVIVDCNLSALDPSNSLGSAKIKVYDYQDDTWKVVLGGI